MNTKELIKFYKNKEHVSCQLTEELIKSGYQQDRNGYTAYAHEKNIVVDYTEALPTQWWHLMESYCERTSADTEFPYSVRCGELYFWMAEVSNEFTEDELRDLMKEAISACDKIRRRNKKLPPLNTAKGNLIILDYCYERLKKS